MANLRRLAYDLLDHAKLTHLIAIERGEDYEEWRMNRTDPTRPEGLLDVAEKMQKIAVLLIGYFPPRTEQPEYVFNGSTSWELAEEEEQSSESENEEQEPPTSWCSIN